MRFALPAALVSMLSACGLSPFGEDESDFDPVVFSSPETRVAYDVEIVGAPDEDVADTLESALSLYTRQDDGAQSVGFLRRRAEDDIPTALRALKAEGWLSASARVEVEEVAGLDPDLIDEAQRAAVSAEAAVTDGEGPPERFAQVRLILEPGPRYDLAEQRWTLRGAYDGPDIALPPAAEMDSPVGAPARAAPILAAEDRVLARLRDGGRPWAEALGRGAVADPEAETLTVSSRFRPGPYVRYGEVRFEGLETVEEDHVRTYVAFERGEPVRVGELRALARELMATDLFGAVSVDVPAEAPEPLPEDHPEFTAGREVPVTVRTEERLPRTVAAGVRYDTDKGAQVRARFRHRNLFGSGETLDARAEAGLDEQVLAVEFAKPQYLRPGQDLVAGLELRSEQDEAFDETSATATLGLERQLTREIRVGLGGLVEVARIEDRGRTETTTLVGLPATAVYDDTGDPLDRRDGFRLSLAATPFQNVTGGIETPFLVLDGAGAVYQPLDAEKDYVLAGRARVGSILSEELSNVPPQHRFYSGGGGSVRGFAERFVGPLDSANQPVGGRSVVELGTELRARLFGDLGGVVFVEGALVGREPQPDFDEEPLFAAGAGLRYWSPVGPIRIDAGVPLNGRDIDDAFAVYLSIGQAY